MINGLVHHGGPMITLFFILVIFCMFCMMIVNGETSQINQEDQQALDELLMKTKGWLKFTTTSSSKLQLDFKVYARARTIKQQKHHRDVPLYRGRALVNYRGDESRIRLVSTSSLLQKSIFYDSDMNAYTETYYQDKEKVTIPTEIQFQKILQELHQSASSSLVPRDIEIYDEAADRLCPANVLDRHVINFAHQHYLLCVEKNDLSHLRYIIGKEFTVQITATSVLTLDSAESKAFNENSVKIRGGLGSDNKKEQVEKKKDEEIFLSSPEIISEFESIKSESRVGEFSLHFPTEKKQVASSEKHSRTLSALSNSKAYFFHTLACEIPYLKSEKCEKKEKSDNKYHKEGKVCMFLHGAGQWPEDKGEPINQDFVEYWGPMSDYTPQCSERWYIREETKNREWDNVELQKSYCDLLLLKHLPENANSDNTVVKDKIIFAHSMGNLILAEAIRNGICSIDKSTVSWYNIMGPNRGSKAADTLQDICENKKTVQLFPASVLKTIAAKGGYCLNKSSPELFMTYASLKPSYRAFGEIQEILASHVKGQMCGTSSTGLSTYLSPALGLLSKIVDYGELNDGLVPLSSCVIGDYSLFSKDHHDLRYAVAANHADGTCRSGDAWFGNVRPCSYYYMKV